MARMVWIVCFLALMTVSGLTVADEKQEKVVFFALGDQGSGNENQQRVAHAMEQVATRSGGVDFVVLLGDNFYADGVSSVTDPQWQTKFEAIYAGPMLDKTPFHPIVGNHDARGNVQAEVEYGRQRLGTGRWRMQDRHYLLDRGRTKKNNPLMRLVLLDATQSLDAQIRFLRNAFDSQPAQQPLWRLVASHYPVRSSGAHGESRALLDQFLPALQNAKVHLHLSGHDHDLELLKAPGEPVYVVSGAGGASLYPLGTRSQWSSFVAQRHGFLRVEITATALDLTLYDDQARNLHQTRIDE